MKIGKIKNKKLKSKTEKRNTIFSDKKAGAITAYLLVATSVAVTLLSGLIVFVSSSQRRSSDEAARYRALNIAESGIYYYRWYLAHALDGKTAEQVADFWRSSEPLGVENKLEKNVIDFSGQTIGTYEIEVTPPDVNSTIVSVTSTGWDLRHPEIKKKVKVRFRRPSWSEYSVLGNDVMRFGDGTTTYGPVHSNNGIRFDGVANNVVTSGVATYDDPDTKTVKPGVWTSKPNENAVFLAGKEFPVAMVDFNSVVSDLSHMRDEAQSSGVYYSGADFEKKVCSWKSGKKWCGASNTWCQICTTEYIPVLGYHVTLRTDDKAEIRSVFDYQGNNIHEPDTYKIKDESDPEVIDIPESGLMFFERNVWVDGQINTNKVTIVAAIVDTSEDANIYINNDVLYTNKDGRDIIGLIAENDISVGLYSENDLEIDAALLAQKGRVGRDYYTQSHSSQFYVRDRITIYGSIATNKRYGFAWTDGSGYQFRDIFFDNNLVYYPPPYFPTGSVYELDMWEDL